MRAILLLLITTVLFTCLVSGVVLNLMIVIVKVYGSIGVTWQLLVALYAVATLIVVGLLWLFVQLGAR